MRLRVGDSSCSGYADIRLPGKQTARFPLAKESFSLGKLGKYGR